ncbi:COQ9 family protein [Hirschia litorea]|uniref:COQ9 family protein n=1 Tax=Hirschia litorea TaxID=1199156 RepID=A0ABW2INX3_9PROT
MNAQKSTESTDIPPSRKILAQLLDGILEDSVFEGWNDETLRNTAKRLNISKGQVLLAAPEGISSLLEAWADNADDHARDILKNTDLTQLKIRQRIALGVRARISYLSDNKEAARRASHALAAPWRAGLGPKIIWNAADTIWSALGDKSTDANWYSKRLVLSGVLTSTISHWLASDDENDDSTWEYLDDRIENVMQFEKAKAQVKNFTDKLPDPLDLLKFVPKSGPLGK